MNDMDVRDILAQALPDRAGPGRSPGRVRLPPAGRPPVGGASRRLPPSSASPAWSSPPAPRHRSTPVGEGPRSTSPSAIRRAARRRPTHRRPAHRPPVPRHPTRRRPARRWPRSPSHRRRRRWPPRLQAAARSILADATVTPVSISFDDGPMTMAPSASAPTVTATTSSPPAVARPLGSGLFAMTLFANGDILKAPAADCTPGPPSSLGCKTRTGPHGEVLTIQKGVWAGLSGGDGIPGRGAPHRRGDPERFDHRRRVDQPFLRLPDLGAAVRAAVSPPAGRAAPRARRDRRRRLILRPLWTYTWTVGTATGPALPLDPAEPPAGRPRLDDHHGRGGVEVGQDDLGDRGVELVALRAVGQIPVGTARPAIFASPGHERSAPAGDVRGAVQGEPRIPAQVGSLARAGHRPEAQLAIGELDLDAADARRPSARSVAMVLCRRAWNSARTRPANSVSACSKSVHDTRSVMLSSGCLLEWSPESLVPCPRSSRRTAANRWRDAVDRECCRFTPIRRAPSPLPQSASAPTTLPAPRAEAFAESRRRRSSIVDLVTIPYTTGWRSDFVVPQS